MVRSNKFTREDADAVIETSKKQIHVGYSLLILEQCLETYRPEEIFLSFNGGKDCTAILHLTAAMLMVRELSPVICLNITGDSFPELDDFINQAKQYYGIELIQKNGPIKSAVIELLNENIQLKATLMGIRQGDPGSDKLDSFKITDSDWPKLMRVCPILHWTYNQVWEFLLAHKVPYCSLYDKGYTSLGDRSSTVPNPLLKDPKNPSHYLPAYTLVDTAAERHGREQ